MSKGLGAVARPPRLTQLPPPSSPGTPLQIPQTKIHEAKFAKTKFAKTKSAKLNVQTQKYATIKFAIQNVPKQE